ncbi:hypothetical protein [Parerythrobacter lacustris]|uniref:Uncharacterized protein n=1 Tax=Parerythrobacter lacustris TaxID=2969984 RepID=A0ABT1XS26_9SPHN|nr:hypothetical protein [Parerythrobacter lacustris]MCR2833490.1 hypothetical protein [Parerythrobacter lacustris]
MNTKTQYREYRDEVSKDAAKALAFFFLGVPSALFVLAWLIL